MGRTGLLARVTRAAASINQGRLWQNTPALTDPTPAGRGT